MKYYRTNVLALTFEWHICNVQKPCDFIYVHILATEGKTNNKLTYKHMNFQLQTWHSKCTLTQNSCTVCLFQPRSAVFSLENMHKFLNCFIALTFKANFYKRYMVSAYCLLPVGDDYTE